MWKWTAFEFLALTVYVVLFTSSYVTQAITIIRNKSSENVDMFAFVRLCIGQTFFTIYSFTLKRIGFFSGAALTLLSLIFLSIVIFRYRGAKVRARA